MTTRTTPPILTPYLALPPQSALHLLTSVLGASTNWLVLRYLATFLGSPLREGAEIEEREGEGRAEGVNVVLLSFLRDGAFWRDGGRRVGVDLDKSALQKRFAFVDGLSGLFVPVPPSSKVRRDETIIRSARLKDVEEALLEAIGRIQKEGRKTVLILDGLDALLAMGVEGANADGLGTLLMGLREMVHATILTLAADEPFVGTQRTPLETEGAAFILGAAHQADMVIALRLLDTGTARDVSGVMRIAVKDAEDDREVLDDRELLYFVGGDGGVRVFERGS